MSLVIASCFREGIAFAVDPFVFDNHPELPVKALEFNKVIASHSGDFLMTGVGSQWVFQKAWKFIQQHPDLISEDSLHRFGEEWARIDQEWKVFRQKNITPGSTLRHISDSIFIFSRKKDLTTIFVGQPDGNVRLSNSFALTGSGTDLVREFLRAKKITFDPEASFEECFDLLRQCFEIASTDLFVVGFPVIALLTKHGVIHLKEACEDLFHACRSEYFSQLLRMANNTLANC